jgi:hypothetical protein
VSVLHDQQELQLQRHWHVLRDLQTQQQQQQQQQLARVTLYALESKETASKNICQMKFSCWRPQHA